MKQLQNRHFLAASALALGLTACGGGDGGNAAPAAPVVTTTTFSGTAATGAALVNAAVSIVCASGTGSTTTSATGTYSTAIASVTLPCALRATSADGRTVLYSVTTAAATTATTQTTNITPLTQLLVASLIGADPATFFNNFSASTATVINSDNVAAAQTAVLNILTAAGITTTGLTDLIAGALTADSHSGYDGVLDAVRTQLTASGQTLQEALAALTTTVAATSPAATAPGTTVVDHTPRLPANLQLRAAAINCTALRSGDYVSITPQKNSTLDDQLGFVAFDAATLTFTEPGNSSGGGTLTANGNCSYTIGSDSYVVSKAGILLGTDTEASAKYLNLIFPKQTIAVAELAGSWNAINFEKNDAGTAYSAHAITADFSSSGAVSNLNDCVGATTSDTCSVSTTTINLKTNSAGGFDMVGSGTNTWTLRAFAYRSGSGDLMLLSLGGGGSFTAWTKKRTLVLPTVGAVNPGGWSVRINNQLAIVLSEQFYPSTTKSVDASIGSYTTTQQVAGGVADYDDVRIINTPRAGYILRNPQTPTSVRTGLPVTVRERTSLPTPGTGLSFHSIPAISSFQVTIEQ